jgi:transposase
LADYGANRRPRPWQPPPPEFRQLHALLQRLEALEKDLQRERNRQEKATVSAASATVLASLARSIAFLEQEKKRLLSEIDGHIDRYPHLRADRDRLLSIPGIGPVLSRWALTLLQHGQRFSSAAQFAAYLGLIPSEHRSGETVYQRPQLSKTGPGHLRAKFYMAAMVAVRYNTSLRFRRIIGEGIGRIDRSGILSSTIASRISASVTMRFFSVYYALSPLTNRCTILASECVSEIYKKSTYKDLHPCNCRDCCSHSNLPPSPVPE